MVDIPETAFCKAAQALVWRALFFLRGDAVKPVVGIPEATFYKAVQALAWRALFFLGGDASRTLQVVDALQVSHIPVRMEYPNR